ncbi:unnamed protein product [Toxocara canis]|uniref:Protein kinase domain-containing protein n=1 Tax=Toxocara canis TaxID=6265 RepID=A0A183UYJ7_TOXCA|nr:unnamed protein product [Toxocara canis]
MASRKGSKRRRKRKSKEEDEKLIESGSGEDSDESDDDESKKKAKKKGDGGKGKRGKSTKGNKTDTETKSGKKTKRKIILGPMARKKMNPGVIINTDLHKYEILSVLGAGGFGDVYKVQQIENMNRKGIYALKTETNGPKGRTLNRLKVHEVDGCRQSFVRLQRAPNQY